ncbi:hypothetical protein AVEN_151722-1 [Araneus ventricosus]|uniref:Uncharacterized protein n=1 Tax=Araneus ventricosus TaxID=182803 RepID=A0A4Y2DN04_ARAVE|nr:hypothetical protein AVEN_151722-1 [Araneus ventricosus]
MSGLRGRRAPGSKPDSIEDPPCIWAWCTLNPTPWVNRPPTGMVQKYPHWPSLSKKGVRPEEDQWGESRQQHAEDGIY